MPRKAVKRFFHKPLLHNFKGVKNMNTPWMLITGCTIIGWIIPEAFAAFGKCSSVPAVMNLLSAIAFGFIAASFV
jgi:MFS superfamily sulfate permease-like transporter